VDQDPEIISFTELPQHPVRVALVLGSGGARGMAHIGVLEELEEAQIKIDLIVGCSAGSLIGALYADHPHAESLMAMTMHRKREDFFELDWWRCRYGIMHRKPFIEFINSTIGNKTFEQLKIPLIVVATDLCRGEKVCFASGPIAPTIHASCAVPFCMCPVKYNGRVLVDGGVIDPVPVSVAKQFNPALIIAVDISSPLDVYDEPGHLFDIATRSAEISRKEHTRLCTQGADILIQPNVGDTGMFEDECNGDLYFEGRRAAREALPRILEKLNSL
jgi:NTE family protein